MLLTTVNRGSRPSVARNSPQRQVEASGRVWVEPDRLDHEGRLLALANHALLQRARGDAVGLVGYQAARASGLDGRGTMACLTGGRMVGEIVFVCGHSNWGKSWTLRPLTGGHHQGRRADIGGEHFWVRKMSNDDDSKKFLAYYRSLRPSHRRYVIGTLCPKFLVPGHAVREALDRLAANGFRASFWVIEQQQSGRGGRLQPEEIAELKRRGGARFELFSGLAKPATREAKRKRPGKRIWCGGRRTSMLRVEVPWRQQGDPRTAAICGVRSRWRSLRVA